jgi:hypothetical protein
LKTGALASTRDLFQQVDDEKVKKTKVGMTNFIYWQQYLPNGSVWWLLVKPWTSSNWAMHAVMYRCIAMAIGKASKS